MTGDDVSILAQTFDVTPKEAVELQNRLLEYVELIPLKKRPQLIGGADVSMNRFATEGFAGFVAFLYPELEFVAKSIAKQEIRFPYIPGLLSFRELPMLLPQWDTLLFKPDVILVDGMGIAHPRRLGIATHLGLALGVPTIGVAKKVLTGTYDEPDDEPGSASPLIDPVTRETIGAVLRTKKGVKPLIISPGHLITLEESIDIVLATVRKHRLPEPTRLAHLAVNEERRGESENKRDIIRS